jgi:hypothetical protein
VCVPLKNGQTKAVITLKALVLLNQEDRDVRSCPSSFEERTYDTLHKGAAMLRMKSKYDNRITENVQGMPSLKRKAVYSDAADADATGRQLSRMRID